MDVTEFDLDNAALAIRLELYDLEAFLTAFPAHTAGAQTRERISTLRFQLEEIAISKVQPSDGTLQESMHLAMPLDFPEVDRLLTQNASSTDGRQQGQINPSRNNSNFQSRG
ncbi:uncharacterized protein Z519_01193 [Cladophialophora bantiana CBS 173.52]|uniref:Uncharacterized protein n=1 Tax=Cladophialophora bantiana (strain ATCC 10958 / CBS 173.52 / CDC B-1940 / NIH 8579) TaxID=1442370 RepID=A0A0D2ILE0_CLAB1|nr:uncharacterized protein Z519_01193 [Cladophialophora bantiana CBS 173.52]KIW97609.1 hypothetical protein Z519_01193 [Cladophialophora bantiana CBS 173.52]